MVSSASHASLNNSKSSFVEIKKGSPTVPVPVALLKKYSEKGLFIPPETETVTSSVMTFERLKGTSSKE